MVSNQNQSSELATSDLRAYARALCADLPGQWRISALDRGRSGEVRVAGPEGQQLMLLALSEWTVQVIGVISDPPNHYDPYRRRAFTFSANRPAHQCADLVKSQVLDGDNGYIAYLHRVSSPVARHALAIAEDLAAAMDAPILPDTSYVIETVHRDGPVHRLTARTIAPHARQDPQEIDAVEVTVTVNPADAAAFLRHLNAFPGVVASPTEQ